MAPKVPKKPPVINCPPSTAPSKALLDCVMVFEQPKKNCMTAYKKLPKRIRVSKTPYNLTRWKMVKYLHCVFQAPDGLTAYVACEADIQHYHWSYKSMLKKVKKANCRGCDLKIIPYFPDRNIKQHFLQAYNVHSPAVQGLIDNFDYQAIALCLFA